MKTAVGEGETECMLSSYQSRDLLRRFSGGFSPDELAEANSSDSDEIELGLSLGGCFNSPNSHKNRILRTSSIPAILPCEVPQLFPLLRTCSLPEEDMQNKTGMKRKRKREELEDGTFLKLKKFQIENEGSWIRGSGPANGVSSLMASRWMGGAGLPSPLRKLIAPASQVSAMSEGSNSSGGSELESRSGQGFELSGFSHGSEIRSPSRFMTTSEHNIHKSPTFSPSLTCPSSKPPNCTAISKSIMKEMPLVSTKGEGPKGLKIEGFLYKYGRGEEVRIVCVCHGSFLTPAEFVKHAGGGDVAHPLRHIVVNPNRASALS